MVYDDSRTRYVWSIEDIRTTTPQLNSCSAIIVVEDKGGGLGQICSSLESSICVVWISVEQPVTVELANQIKRKPFTNGVLVIGGIPGRESSRVPGNIIII